MIIMIIITIIIVILRIIIILKAYRKQLGKSFWKNDKLTAKNE
jgi:hypothetical protein